MHKKLKKIDFECLSLPAHLAHVLGWMVINLSQHWFRLWLGAVRQQAVTWTYVDPDLCHQMASLGQSELMPWKLKYTLLHLFSSWTINSSSHDRCIKIWFWMTILASISDFQWWLTINSTLVQVTSHYLNQCWPRSMLSNGITRPKWVNAM